VNASPAENIVDRACQKETQRQTNRRPIDSMQKPAKGRKEEQLRCHQHKTLMSLAVTAEEKAKRDEDSKQKYLAK